MKRREFITLLGGAAAAWPLAARAQQAGELPTVGFLGVSAPSAQDHFVAELRAADCGNSAGVEGRNVIDRISLGGRSC